MVRDTGGRNATQQHPLNTKQTNSRWLSVLFAMGVAIIATGCGVSTTGSSAQPTSTSGSSVQPTSTTGSSAQPTGTAGSSSGTLSGQVVARSSCGAQNSVTPCALAPVGNATLSIETATGAMVATVTSDQQGHFSVVLSPGHYIIQPIVISGSANIQGATVGVDVVSGGTISVQIVVNAGPPRS